MLGPSFSPSIARIPGPTRSHSRYQRLPCNLAWWTRPRSRDLAVSSSVSLGGCAGCPGACGAGSRGGAAVSGVPIDRPSGELDAHRAGELAAKCVLVIAERDEQGSTERLALADREAVAGRDPAVGQVAEHLGV